MAVCDTFHRYHRYRTPARVSTAIITISVILILYSDCKGAGVIAQDTNDTTSAMITSASTSTTTLSTTVNPPTDPTTLSLAQTSTSSVTGMSQTTAGVTFTSKASASMSPTTEQTVEVTSGSTSINNDSSSTTVAASTQSTETTATATSSTATTATPTAPSTVSTAATEATSATPSTTSSILPPPAANTTGIIIGVVVGVGGFILIIIAIFLIRLLLQFFGIIDKRPPEENNPMTSVVIVNKAGDTLDIQRVEKTDPLPERLVPLEAFLQYVAEHQAKMLLYTEEFKRLPREKEELRTVALANEVLNRYSNILPYDFNRVILQTSSEMENNFINASYIEGVESEKAYVATQGPMEKPPNQANTFGSFWHMIWDLQCEKIAMVTNLVEGNKVKCAQYWPKNVTEPLRCGKFSVRLLDQHVNHEYTLRKLSLHKEGHPDRFVKHLHYTVWPDQGVPDTCTSLLKFHKVVFSPPSKAPVVIHCSAGVGRSGTLIALDMLLQMANKQGNVDVPKCVDGLRRQRMWMVQTLAQYIFLHHALLEGLLLNDVTLPSSDDFKDKYTKLFIVDPATGKSKFQCQFEVLDVLKPMHGDAVCSIAKKEKYRDKNRSDAVLPADHCRLSLLPVEEDDNTYINAVYVDGYGESRKSVFVATQFPLAGTTSDFWRLVKDTRCIAIVMLNSIDQTNNNSEQYWPADGRNTMTGRFTISNAGPELSSDNVLTTNLKIVYEGKIKFDYRDSRGMTNRKSLDSDDETDEEEENDESGLTTNGVELKSSDPEPVYANMSQSKDDKPAIAVRHIRVLNWPNDSEFPTDYSTLLTLHSEITECLRKNPDGRILIHCLYGAERTGLFAAMLNVMDALAAQKCFDIFNSVKRVRQSRPEFIPTLAQYKYLYELAQHCQNAAVEPPVDYPLYANSVEL